MRVTMLGCGASSGVPMIGCDCAVCRSDNPKNKRTRVSILIEINGKNILIDTPPDLRQQCLRHDIRRIDAVLFTHDHADHTHGIDELRSFNYLSGHALPVYADPVTLDKLQKRFAYVFQPKPENIWFRPALESHIIEAGPVTGFSVLDIKITGFEQIHGKTRSLGFRIGDFAYSTDVNELPDTAIEALKGVKTWIVDSLRYKESLSHSTRDRTLGWIERVKPERAIFTHMAHDFDYDTLASELPSGVVPGYDGMILEL